MVGKDHQRQQGALMAVAVVVLRLLLLVVGDSYKGEWVSAATATRSAISKGSIRINTIIP